MTAVALALLLVTPAAPVPRETDARKLVRLWGDWLDPDKGSKYAVAGNRVRVTAGKGPRGLNPQAGLNNAPRALRPVTGDFTVSVSVFADAAPVGSSRGGPDYSLSGGGGLLLWVSEDLHVRLSRSHWLDEPNLPAKTTYNFRGVSDGDALPDQVTNVPPENKPVTFRLVRQGGKVTAGYTFDGKLWKDFAAVQLELPETVKVGIYVAHNFDRPLTVEFDPLIVVNKK